MERRPLRDFVVGLFVLAGLAALGYLSLSIGGLTLSTNGGLKLFAEFEETGGLKPRAPVLIAGVKVGEVTSVAAGKDLQARVDLDIDPQIKLSADSSAAILTEGVLGDRYVAIQPGGADKLLKPGDRIPHTESAILLERALAKFGSSLASGPSFIKPGALKIHAMFDETAGLKPRAPVVIGGIKVGEIVGTSLTKDFRVNVEMDLDPDLQLPEDTFASIFTEGLIGDHYIALSPGGSDVVLKSGDAVTHTESAMILERLIGKLVYGLTNSSSGGGAGTSTSPMHRAGLTPGPGSLPATLPNR